jgi:ribonuclease HI
MDSDFADPNGPLSMDATIYTDGAARGNPGPAASAYVLERPGQPALEHAEKIGTATNNVAEYTALILALERVAELGLHRVEIRSDSELMVRQFNGDYSVKNAELKALYDEARALAGKIERVRLVHVRREENRRADQLCNAVLNGKLGGDTLDLTTYGPAAAAPPAVARPNRPRAKAAQKADVRAEAIACLRTALAAASGPSAPTAEQVWEQLWSVLEEAGVLKTRKSKS